MGSFWGHVDEGIFFLVISTWWMFHLFPEYIRKRGRTSDINVPFSYGLPGKPHVPIEIVIKIGFPLCGFIAEFLADGFFNFTDSDGNLQNVENIQHMTIYFLFVLHGLADLCLWYRWPMVKDGHLLILIVAFLWYGVAFMFHAHMEGKAPLETVVHLVPLPVIFGAAATIALRLIYRDGIALPIATAYCVSTLGTWFCHVSFMLYSVHPFPGREPSNWNRSDPNNVAFAVAMLGTHLCLNIIFMWILYVIIYVIMVRGRLVKPFGLPYKDETSKYQPLQMSDDSEISLDYGLDIVQELKT